MIQKPMDVLAQFPIRKNKKQKAAFRDAVQSYVKSLGYECAIEKGGSAHNVVIGNPETAKFLITAHYDTPANMIIPNLITPTNFWAFMAYQMVVTVLLLGIALIPGQVLISVGMDVQLASFAWLISLYAILGLMLFGPANKNNANDNTSGVVTVLATAANLPEALRDRVCFVLFDLEEAGLVGSGQFYKKHKKTAKEQIVLNCDCCGDGSEIIFFPAKKLKKDEKKMDALRALAVSEGEMTLDIREKGFSYYPSDQKHFPYGVGIAAFQSSWAGPYCGKIHTNKDTVLDEKNVIFLRDKLIAFVNSSV